MQSFDLGHFKTINAIIDRDSTDTTYKYALLRGAVEISQEYQHLKRVRDNRIEYPLGLLVEKWLLYYYPFIENDIPQKAGECDPDSKKLSFRRLFRKITQYYKKHGGFSAFYRDYMKGSIPGEIICPFRSLVRDIRKTITQYPMKHFGHSTKRTHYSVFDFDRDFKMPTGKFPVDRDFLIRNMGAYSLSREYDAVFVLLGSFIAGEDAVLFQWAEFTRSASNGNISLTNSLEQLRTFPVTGRNPEPANTYYRQLQQEQGVIHCVWSGRPIMDLRSLEIDHVIPFSILRNNDQWNLLPAIKSVNKDKLDSIPAPEFIEKRRPAILLYWSLLREEFPEQFDREMQISLTGPVKPGSDLQELAFNSLKEKCRYYIDVRGFDSWSL